MSDEVIGEIHLTITDSGVATDTTFGFKDLMFWLDVAQRDLWDQFFEGTRVRHDQSE